MKSSNFKSNVEWLSNPRIAITVAALAAIAVVAFLILKKKLFNGVKGITDKIAENRQDGKYEETTGSKLTEGLRYDDMCDRLWDATVDKLGTDEDQVYQVLGTLLTQADYEKLCDHWRTYAESKSWWKRNITGWGVLNGSVTSLEAVLVSELKDSELAKARRILNQKGINPKF